MSMSICLSVYLYVCLSVCSRNLETVRPNFANFVHVAYGRAGSVLVGQLYDTLLFSPLGKLAGRAFYFTDVFSLFFYFF